MEVHVLVAHPPETTSFVVGAYTSREEAEADRAELATGTPVEVVTHAIAAACPCGRWS